MHESGHERSNLTIKDLNPADQSDRWMMATFALAVVVYCITTLWYVATFPDIGIRCLLPMDFAVTDAPAEGVEIRQFLRETDYVDPVSGDRLLTINRKATPTFLAFIRQLVALRTGPVGNGGQLDEGADPVEFKTDMMPGLVQVGDSQRLVEITFESQTGEPEGSVRAYLAITPIPVFELGLTLVWFLLQGGILVVGLAAYWRRPSDRTARAFCHMSIVALGTFVGGFHWWILAGNPLLNLPWILMGCLLPAIALMFFMTFSRPSPLLVRYPRLLRVIVFGPPIVFAAVIGTLYLIAWFLSGSGTEGELLPIVKRLLYWLRTAVHLMVVLAVVYFSATVITLILKLQGARNPVERRQVFGILTAALVSTLPVAYVLFLAFFDDDGFALGRARLPMFVASVVFMAAYVWGMLRHRLILADDVLSRGNLYVVFSAGVSGAFAVLIAVGGVAAHLYRLPIAASAPQQIALFAVLLTAVAILLWGRDRVQSAVDRRFFSEKYQLDRTLQQLNRAGGHLADPTALADMTLRTCSDVLGVSRAAMFIRDSEDSMRLVGSLGSENWPVSLPVKPFIAAFDEGAVIRRVPSPNRETMSPIQAQMHDLSVELLHMLGDKDQKQVPAGLLALGRKRGSSAFTAEDHAFLQATAQMSMLALHSARANQNLARLNAELKVKVDHIAEQQRQLRMLQAELTSTRGPNDEVIDPDNNDKFDIGQIRGNSPAVRDTLATVRKVAPTDATVLIRGESGTGKELLAEIVHRNSRRSENAFVCVNCAALAPSLLESELFGHLKGSFTGASADKPGRFQAAHGGTLFLDEIGDISLETQVKLLRVLQERSFEPVGSSETISVDVRLIAATNRPLERMIEDGRFREDLFYRLNVISISLPPLRERREDLIELLYHFLKRTSDRTGKTIQTFHPDALELLEQHHWPGNIRELENVVERAVVLCDDNRIDVDDLPPEIARAANSVRAAADSARMKSPLEFTPYRLPSSGGPIFSHSEHESGLDERRMLQNVLRQHGGNKAKAAQAMGVPRSTFYSRLKKHGIR